MKKHFVLIMNIVLAVVILGAVGFTVFNLLNRDNAKHTEKAGGDESATASTDASAQPTVDPSERYKIGIVQRSSNPESSDCYAGFISELNERGLVGNIDIVYIVEEDAAKLSAQIRRLIDEKCDLLYTIGPAATKEAAKLSKEIPIVFAGIADPEQENLIASNENPGGNITGVSSYTPAFEQIDLVKVLLPQTKNIAVIHNATDEYAVTQAIIAEKESEELGIKTERYPVSDADDIKPALLEMKEAGAEVLFLPVDKFVYRYLKPILRYTDAIKLPVIVGNELMLESGAFATCTINYTSVGRMAADQSCDILFQKEDPATLSVIYKYDCYNIVNQASADTLGIQLTETMLDQIKLKDYSAKE